MNRRNLQDGLPQATGLVVLLAILSVLYFLREVLVPLALVILLSFLLAPLVLKLQRWGCGRVPAVMAVAVLAVGTCGVLGWVVASQVMDLTGKLPQYEGNIRQKLQSLHRPGTLNK